MSKSSKRYTTAKAKVTAGQTYSLEEGIKLVKETATVKFDSTVEIHVKLGIDAKKSDQGVRATVSLPHGTGKIQRVVAFVSPDKEKEAKDAGADLYGGKDLIEKIKASGKIEFDVAVATPDIMRDLSAIAKILGQKGLMPNPKVGTVTTNIKQTVEEIKKGRAAFKNDDSANVHLLIGKVSFTDEQLKENVIAFLDALKRMKPEGAKGTFIKNVHLASAMGPGIKIQF